MTRQTESSEKVSNELSYDPFHAGGDALERSSTLMKLTQQQWDFFYKVNSTRFFKNRYWTVHEFQALREFLADTNDKVVLEVGCGAGNFIWPVIEKCIANGTIGALKAFAFDFSDRAVALVREHKLAQHFYGFVADLTMADCCTGHIPQSTVDLCSMIFVLGAIEPLKQPQAVANVFQMLKPGGRVIIRDYAVGDMAQARFDAKVEEPRKLQEQLYLRQDGTMSYFFELNEMVRLFSDVGFERQESAIVPRRTQNFKEGVDVERLFVQGTFMRPHR